MIAKRVIYEGRVQGVGFRYTARELACGYDVTGTVKNLPEGTVELIVVGEEEEVAEFLRDMREDSAVAYHIRGAMEEVVTPIPELRGFSIIR